MSFTNQNIKNMVDVFLNKVSLQLLYFLWLALVSENLTLLW